MRITFLIANGYAMGGTIRTTLNTAGELAARGHEVEVVSVYRRRDEPVIPVSPQVTLRALLDERPVTRAARAARRGPVGRGRQQLRSALEKRSSRLIHRQDFRYDRFTLRSDAALLRFLRTLDSDVVIGTRAGLNLAIARLAPRRVVRVAQEHLHLGVYKPQLLAAMRARYPRLDLVSTLTSADAERYRELLGDSAPLVVMPNAAPRQVPRQSSTEAPVVVSAGRLVPQKGFDRLIDAFRIVAQPHPDWQLRIYGGGKLAGKLRKKIDRLDLSSRVQLMGHSTTLLDDLADGSIFAMSSRFEGFPMTLLEAMSCGLPAVSFDLRNGPRDAIRHGVDGLVVPDGDVAALAAGLVELIEDPPRRRAYGKAAAQGMARFRIEAIVDEWERMLSDLVAGKRRQ